MAGRRMAVRGNHDSPLIQSVVAAQPNAVVLDGEVEEVAGLRIWDIGDPRFTPDKSQAPVTDQERARAESFAPRVASRLDDAIPPPVDIQVVHDLRTAAAATDVFRLSWPAISTGPNRRRAVTPSPWSRDRRVGSRGTGRGEAGPAHRHGPLLPSCHRHAPGLRRHHGGRAGWHGSGIERHVVAAAAGFGPRGAG